MNWIARVQYYLLLASIESSRTNAVDRNVTKWYKFSCNGLPCTSELWPHSVVSCRMFVKPSKDLITSESQLDNAYDVVTEVTKDSANVDVDPIIMVTAVKVSSKLKYNEFDDNQTEMTTRTTRTTAVVEGTAKETVTSNISAADTTTNVTSLESTGGDPLRRTNKQQDGWSGFVKLERRKRMPSLVVELSSGDYLHAEELMRSVTGDHVTVACVNHPGEVQSQMDSGMSLSEFQTSHRMLFRLMRHDEMKDLKVVMAAQQDTIISRGSKSTTSWMDFVLLFLLNTL